MRSIAPIACRYGYSAGHPEFGLPLSAPLPMTAKTPAAYRGAIRKIQRLYSIPEVLSKALRLVKEPDVNIESIGKLVSQDAALVADVIRLSNSAIYSRGESCVDLQLALQRLGLDEVVRVIELSMSKHIFGKGLTHYGFTAGQYWRTSVLAAVLMEHFAFVHGIDAPEAYTIGILHALGRVLINEVLEEEKSTLPWDRKGSLENWEVSRVGFTQAEAGALLLREWSFPKAIVTPIENQLGPTRVTTPQSTLGMLRLVKILLNYDTETGLGPPPAALPPDLLGWAGFATEDELLGVLREGQAKVKEIGESLGIGVH